MRVSKRGQITIPKRLRERHGFGPGTEVTVEECEGCVLIRRKHALSRGEEIVRRMTGAAQIKMSTDEILELTRGRT